MAGPGGTVRLEPKVMDVLRFLGQHPGRVVTRDELLQAVWPRVQVTEHTLSRCIYQLRNELGRIAGDPDRGAYDPIETLPKRGYRLLAAVDVVPPMARPVSRRPDSATFPVPFVVGQWVRGDRFYGRSAQIEEILGGPGNCIWLLGTRRIGKTSLLKQIEHLAGKPRDRRYFPLFWDFQGADTPEELHLNFTDALLDAEERLEQVGIHLQEIASDDLFVALADLRRRLGAAQLRLLLLCDEVEELIELDRNHPSLLRKLRHAMQSHEGMRTVLASTIRLWALARRSGDTSPFLHGFAPPLYIQRLTDEEARSLIGQSQLDPEQRPAFAADVVESIRERCDNHPYLLQLVCKRCLETGRLEEAVEQVATDRMVSHFFSVDFEMLDEGERDILQTVGRKPEAPVDLPRDALQAAPDALEGSLRRLDRLGFIRRQNDGRYRLANYFFRRWLLGRRDAPASSVSGTGRLPGG